MPAERLTVTLPAGIEDRCDGSLRLGQLEGVFTHAERGFLLSSGAESYLFPDTEADIPNGTLVRVRHMCMRFLQLRMGKLVAIQNLPALGAQKNPTEDGTRLWSLIVAGGVLLLPGNLPFDYAFEEVCKEGNDEDGYRHAEAVILIDGSKAVVVNPGQEGEIEVTRGEHAGRYGVENVNVVFSDDDLPIEVNFRIRRAD